SFQRSCASRRPMFRSPMRIFLGLEQWWRLLRLRRECSKRLKTTATTFRSEMTLSAEQAWLNEVTTVPAVSDFFYTIGIDLGRPAGDEAMVRCFASPAAHKRDDQVKSCSVSVTTGKWKCHGCGEEGNAYYAALATGRNRGISICR